MGRRPAIRAPNAALDRRGDRRATPASRAPPAPGGSGGDPAALAGEMPRSAGHDPGTAGRDAAMPGGDHLPTMRGIAGAGTGRSAAAPAVPARLFGACGVLEPQ